MPIALSPFVAKRSTGTTAHPDMGFRVRVSPASKRSSLAGCSTVRSASSVPDVPALSLVIRLRCLHYTAHLNYLKIPIITKKRRLHRFHADLRRLLPSRASDRHRLRITRKGRGGPLSLHALLQPIRNRYDPFCLVHDSRFRVFLDFPVLIDGYARAVRVSACRK